MTTLEIPRDEWRLFLDNFTEKHLGDPVTIEVHSLELGSQVEARHRPLLGVSADFREGERNVAVTVGDDGEALRGRLTHVVPMATHIHLLVENGGSDQALEIESDDGTKSLILLGKRAATAG